MLFTINFRSSSRGVWLIVLLLICGILQVGVAAGQDPTYPILYCGQLYEMPLFVAVQKGFFKSEGVAVRLQPSDPERLRLAINSGNAVGFTADYRIFQAIAAGLRLKLVAGLHSGCIRIFTRNDSKIKSIRDLTQKTIGVAYPGDGPMVVASRLLRNNGIPAQMINWRFYPQGGLEEALQRHEIDAASIWEPARTGAQAASQTDRILFSTSGDTATQHTHSSNRHFYGSFMGLSTKLLTERPGQAAAICRAWLNGADWVAQHSNDAVRLTLANHYLAGNFDSYRKISDSYMWVPGVRFARENIRFYLEEQKRLRILPVAGNDRKLLDQVFAPVIPDLNGR